jgi:hypothetical protein
MEKNKRGQFQFSWIFALIVGAVFLFLAFYFVGTTLLGQRYEETTIETQFLDIITDPFVYLGSMGATTYKPLTLPKEYTIITECYYNNVESDLGKSIITLKQKEQTGLERSIYNKYFYAQSELTTKNLNALSKPFELPWRVSDVIIYWPKGQKYCFISAPTRISNEIDALEIEDIQLEDFTSGCDEDSIIVCFYSTSSCDINVKANSVEKDGGIVYYIDDSLMYAAIFSDKFVYNCNLKRLISRLNIQAIIYGEKAKALAGKGCGVQYNLNEILSLSEEISESKYISENQMLALDNAASALNTANTGYCRLF